MYQDNVSKDKLASAPKTHTSVNLVQTPIVSHRSREDWDLILSELPDEWILTPVKDKRPLRPDWQNEPEIPRRELLDLLDKGQTLKTSQGKEWHCQWTGIGLRLGGISGGLIAIDVDGELAFAHLQKISGGLIPPTPSWTSGKEGRRQLLYQISQEHWDKIKTIKIDCDNGQYLEFRWDGCQSVLPPSRHPETGQYNWITSPEETKVESAPPWLLEFIKSKNYNPESEKKSHSIFINFSSSNKEQWSDIDWAKSYLNALAPWRAEDYDSWLKIGMALHSISESLLPEWEIWSQQSAKYSPGVCAGKWETFKPTKGIAIGSLAQWAKDDGWTSPFKSQTKPSYIPSKDSNNQPKTMNNLTNNQDVNQLTIKEAIQLAILSGKSGSDRTSIIFNLSIEYKMPLSFVEKYWREIEGEIEIDLLKQENYSELNKLLHSHNQTLDPYQLFPQDFADQLDTCAKAMPGPVEGLILTLLSTAAGCAGTAAEVILNSATGDTQPCLLRTLLLAETGEMKTPLQKVILDPLKKLEKEAHTTYKEEMREYEEAKAKGDSQEPLTMPTRTRYLVMDATPEKIIKIHAENSKGFMVYLDEWGIYLKGFNKYRGGIGNDREIDLTEFNGDMYLRDRVGDESVLIEKMSISRTSSFQTSLFHQIVDQQQDLDGFLPRWLVAAPKFPKAYKDFLREDNQEVKNLQDDLCHLYRSLRQLTPQSYLLDLDAKLAFQKWQHHLVDLTHADTNFLMRAIYPKLESYTARLALILHLINAITNGESPEPEISGQTMERAIYLAQYFLSQARWLYCKCSVNPSGLSGMMAQIQAYAIKIGLPIGARIIKQAIASIKTNGKASANFIRGVFIQLAEAGHGVVHGTGIHLQYEAGKNPSTNLQNGTALSSNPDQQTVLQSLKNAVIPNLQNETSTFSVVVTLEGSRLRGLGKLAENGHVQVTLHSGVTITVPGATCEFVDSSTISPAPSLDIPNEHFVDNLVENVDSSINIPEPLPDIDSEDFVDLWIEEENVSQTLILSDINEAIAPQVQIAELPNTSPVNQKISEIQQGIQNEIKRLQWTVVKVATVVRKTFGKTSQGNLSENELLQFWNTLKYMES